VAAGGPGRWGAAPGAAAELHRTVRDDRTEVVRRREKRREKESGGGGLPPGRMRADSPYGTNARRGEAGGGLARVQAARRQLSIMPRELAGPPASPASDGSVAVSCFCGGGGLLLGRAGGLRGVGSRRPGPPAVRRPVCPAGSGRPLRSGQTARQFRLAPQKWHS